MRAFALLFAAEWIAGTYVPPPETDEAAFFAPARNDIVERTFPVRNVAVTSAVWRVAAPGMRDLFANGERVTSTALPPLTPYRKRVLEESFDITANMRKGRENSLRIELGNGWFNPLPIRMWYVHNLRDYLAIGTPCVKATLEIAYLDGVCEKIETDATWKAASGRIIHNDIYLGVVEDRRLAVEFANSARVVKGPPGRVVPAEDLPKVEVYDKWMAKSVTQISNNVWLVDMGVNATGTLRARLRGVPAGEKVRFRQGERIWPDGTVNVMTAVAGQIKNPEKGPLFAVAEQRDSVIGDGSLEFVFEPRLTFHVFRYVQVEGPCEAPRPEDFEMRAWSVAVKDCGHFQCSNAEMNTLHEICRRTFRSNLHSVQSDCPGREKFGYGGDIAVTAESFRCNWFMAEFYRKTIRDFLDEAEDNGIFTETSPYVGIGTRPLFPPKETGGRRASPMGCAMVVPVLVDLLVRYDGDLEIVREAYPALSRFVGLLSARYPQDEIPECIGDWLAIEKADTGLSALANWHEFLTKMARFARLIGKEADSADFAAHAARVRERFRRLYMKPGGVVNRGFQGEQLYALYSGLVEPHDVPAALDVLKRDIIAHGRSLTTAPGGTWYLFEVLSSNGMADLAGDVATHRGFPGYIHMIERGATTLWEQWNESECLDVHSNCHPFLGSVDQWFMRYVLGICVPEDAVGCDKVRIVPHAVAGITSASGWLDTPKGRISVSWKLEEGRLNLNCKVPEGIEICR